MPSKDLTRAQCLERMLAPLRVRAQLGHKPRERGQLAETLRFVKKAGRRGGRRAGYLDRRWVGGGWWRGGDGSGYRVNIRAGGVNIRAGGVNIRAGDVGGSNLGGSSFFRRCGNPTPTAAAAAAAATATRESRDDSRARHVESGCAQRESYRRRGRRELGGILSMRRRRGLWRWWCPRRRGLWRWWCPRGRGLWTRLDTIRPLDGHGGGWMGGWGWMGDGGWMGGGRGGFLEHLRDGILRNGHIGRLADDDHEPRARLGARRGHLVDHDQLAAAHLTERAEALTAPPDQYA